MFSCGPRKLARALTEIQKHTAEEGSKRAFTRSTSNRPGDRLGVPNPQAFVHRSMSDIVRENAAAAHAVAGAHSPLVSAGMPVAATTSPSLPLGSPKGLRPGEYFSPRVLLVDDNAINLKLLVVFAKRQKLQYFEAMNGLIALEQYKKDAMASEKPTKPFDVVLMDLSMPVMGGLEATRQIRQFESEHDIPRCTIVALTGLASAQDQQDAVDAGVDMYLVKPVKFTDIKRLFDGK